MGCNRKNRAGLRETMRSWEASAEGSRPETPELPLGIPPLRKVHLAESSDNQA